MSRPTDEEILDALREATGVGAELALREFAARAFHTERKVDGSPVTSADLQVERRITERLRQVFPDVRIVGEESAKAVKDELAEYIAVDPIDGTSNFVRGVPFFAITAVYVSGGRPIVGVVLDPVHDSTFWAIRGEGAYRDGGRLSLPTGETRTKLDRATIAVAAESLPRSLQTGLLPAIAGRANRVQSLRAVALEIAGLAAGWIDAAIFNNIAVWDVAAAALILEESGGVWSDVTGSRHGFTAFHHEYSFVGAAHATLHDQILALVHDA